MIPVVKPLRCLRCAGLIAADRSSGPDLYSCRHGKIADSKGQWHWLSLSTVQRPPSLWVQVATECDKYKPQLGTKCSLRYHGRAAYLAALRRRREVERKGYALVGIVALLTTGYFVPQAGKSELYRLALLSLAETFQGEPGERLPAAGQGKVKDGHES